MDFERYTSLKPRMQAVDDKHPAIKYPYTEIIEKEGKEGHPSLVIQKASLERDKTSPFGEYAIAARDRVNAKGETERTKLEIQCETMQKALHSIFGEHSLVGIRADPIVFQKPYYPLFHCRLEIQEMAKKESNTPDQKQHLDWLTDFMAKNFKELESVQSGLVDKGLIEFKHLPIIFEVGSIIVGHIQGEAEATIKTDNPGETKRPECFLFHHISDQIEDKTTGGKYMEVTVFRWGYNGSMFGLTPERLRIKEFTGPRRITDLECFPFKYLKEVDISKLVLELIERGKRWCDYVEARNFDYKGVAQSPIRSTWSWEVKIVPRNMPGRVVLDHLAFVAAFPELNTPLQSKSRGSGKDNLQDILESTDSNAGWKISPQITLPPGNLWNCYEREGYSPTDGQALLCPASAPGYSLAQKDWGYFDIASLGDVEWTPNPLQGLELNPVQKEMLIDLIVEHHSKAPPNEIVPVKGEGLIFLLHGPPGCGKTLTAELMAEEDRRALLRISCSDLGQHPCEVERNLQALLKLALRCSAIVLIDEADTFLSRRSSGGGGGIRDYFHNAIASIFLRHLEYFPGVIFLTTNQGAVIDDAVSSRAIRLSYGPLQPLSRSSIWRSNLLKSQDSLAEQDIELLSKELGDKYVLDGREIKTLAHLSLSVCRRRKQQISLEIIQQMYDLTHGADVICK